jgi:DNA-directed RNA polymerase subunit RPC12/RpoP
MFAINFWGTFLLTATIQFIFPHLYEKYAIYQNVRAAVDEYNKKPYKKYNIPLTCQYCGREEGVDIDLEDTTYKCGNCSRTNAIYVTFTTAAISESGIV